MPTNKPRLNITLSPEMEVAIRRLAERDRVPRSRKAAVLLLEAIELEEDRAFDELAQKRDKKSAKFTSHKKAWR